MEFQSAKKYARPTNNWRSSVSQWSDKGLGTRHAWSRCRSGSSHKVEGVGGRSAWFACRRLLQSNPCYDGNWWFVMFGTPARLTSGLSICSQVLAKKCNDGWLFPTTQLGEITFFASWDRFCIFTCNRLAMISHCSFSRSLTLTRGLICFSFSQRGIFMSLQAIAKVWLSVQSSRWSFSLGETLGRHDATTHQSRRWFSLPKKGKSLDRDKA